MSRLITIVVILLVLLIGGIVFLSTRSTEQEPVRMEKAVPLDNLTN
ncbi:hypothetical protein [Sphingomonas sp. M1-B02]|nr:hypothetical protein [Sphingomonas sp. S6-11]UZK66368.1 hypothetical protein OKW87_00560 [Sphingomonas sp. S6-11]